MSKRLKGINTDVDPIDQPEGTYRDAQNAVLTERLGAITSEGGNATDSGGAMDIPAGYEILGDTLIYDGRHVLFVTDGTTSEIGVFNGTAYTTLFSDADITNGSLNFQSGSVVEATNVINNRNDVIIYWTDNINPPRYLNIDDIEQIDEVTSINIFPTIQDAPKIELDDVNQSGGQLLSGAYYFAIALYSEDDSRTNYMSLTPPVYINDDPDPSQHAEYDGCPAGTQTSKSIRLSVDNLDTEYDQFELVVIRKEEQVIAEVSKIPKQRIAGTNSIYNYTGSEETISSSLDEIVINTASYETARTIEEQDNTLYLGNLTKKPDVGYQKFANNITINSIVDDLEDGGAGMQGRDHYGNPVLSFYDKSFKRGEVYAFYISFVLENGQESQAYHIPGRVSEGSELNEQADYTTYQISSEKGTNDMGYWENKDETYPDTEDWDIFDVDANGDPSQIGTLRPTGGTPVNVRHHRFPDAHNDMSFWDGEDTSPYGKKLGIELSDVKIPKSIIGRVRAVKVYYAERDVSNQIILDQGYGFPMRSTENSPAGEDDRAWMYTTESESDADVERSSSGIFFDAFHSLRTKKNIGSVSYIREVAQPEGPTFADTGDSDNEEVFFDSTDQMYYSDGGLFPVKAITYLPANTYVSGITAGFFYNIDNSEGEEGIAIEFDDGFSASWDGVGKSWSARDTESGLTSNGSAGRIFELIQLLNNVYFPFDQQELIWTGVQINDIDLFDPRTTGGSSGTVATGEIDITGDSEPLADYAEAVLEIDTTKPASGHIEVTANNINGTEDHTINVDGNTTAPVTIEGYPEFLQSQSIGTQSPDPDSIFFKPDGTKIYILSRVGDEIDEYDLSTPWDITTASYLQSFDVTPQDNEPDGIFFKGDGLKLYITGDQNTNIYEYDLGTAWDVSTAVFNQSLDTSTETINSTGLSFKDDGTKLYLLSEADAMIYEYDLSVAWDISTATINQSKDISAEDTEPDAIFFKSDGLKVFVVGKANDNVYEYGLSTAWDISTATLTNTLDISTQDTMPDGISFKPDGTKFYHAGRTGDAIYEYDIHEPWSLGLSDSVEDIVTKYRDAINADGTISADWTATIEDQGGGIWRTIITSDARGTTWNGRTIDVTGETNVTLTTANSTGGQDVASAGNIGVQFNSPHGLFEIDIALSGGEDSDQVAALLSAELDSELVFNLFYDAVVDTGPIPPTITITATSNGTYMNTDIVLNTGSTDVIFTKDGEIDGGADNGAFDFRQSIGYIEVVSIDTTGNIDVSMPEAPGILVNVAVDTSNSIEQTAQDISDSLEATTQLDEYDFFAYEDRVYYYDPGGFDFDGDEATVADDTGAITANTTPIANGRDSEGDGDEIEVSISTPELNDVFTITIVPGDDAATIESKIVTQLNGYSAFSNKYTASGSPVSIVSDAVGSSYNGALNLNVFNTGATFTTSNLSGGTDAETEDFSVAPVYGGDTFISLYGTKRTMWDEQTQNENYRHLVYFPCESQDNIKLRHAGSEYEEIYYPKSEYDAILSLEIDKPSGYEEVVTFDNFRGYNPDYSTSANIKSAIPLSKDAESIEEYPTRIIRSAEGDQTQGDSGIRTFLESDFLDLTKSRGELVKLVVMQNTIMPHMERSLIRTKGREEISTGDFRAFLGAGDIFSVKPDEILPTREGFGGLQDQRCSMITPTGYFFVDRAAGQVILMSSNGPEIISENGLKNFFSDELQSAGQDELICGYDNEWDRIMLSRKGHWTVSYYPGLKAWGSFHSYDPEYYLYDLDTFYTLKSDSLYAHNVDTDPCHFYGEVSPDDFIFEFVSNPEPAKSKKFHNIEFITDVEDSSGNKIWDETFDQFRVSNDRQDSGDQNIVVFTSLGDGSNARNIEGTWKINKFRDLLVNGSIDTNKPWYDQSQFISKYIRVKLIFNNSDQKSIYLYDARASATLSRR